MKSQMRLSLSVCTNLPWRLGLRLWAVTVHHRPATATRIASGQPYRPRLSFSPDLTRSSATAEIVRVGGRYAVQGHSRSLMLPIESPYASS